MDYDSGSVKKKQPSEAALSFFERGYGIHTPPILRANSEVPSEPNPKFPLISKMHVHTLDSEIVSTRILAYV